MFLEVLEQILNARKGLLFEASVKTHGREEAFEICQKAQKQKNPNSEIGSFSDIVGFMETALFSAEIHELHKILHWIRIRLEKSGMQGKEVRRIELAAEEAVVNVILHGYEGKKGRLEVGFKKGPGRIELLFRDWGPPFDPLSNAPEVDPAAPLEQREAGGLGIFFMRQIMDEIVYQRENNANVLSMLKNL